MKKRFFLLFLCITPMLFSQEEASQIYEKMTTINKPLGMEGVSTLTIYDSKGRTRVRKVAQISKLYDGGKTEKTLVRFLSPADVEGSGLLTFDFTDKNDDLWLYLPALRKSRRIISSEKASSFMGSEFTYADISPGEGSQFDITSLGEEKIGEVDVYKIQLVPKDDDVANENGFYRQVLWVGKDDYMTRQAHSYDYNDEILRVITVSKVELLDESSKIHVARYLEVVNHSNGRRSTLSVDQVLFNPNVDDSYFTQAFLKKS